MYGKSSEHYGLTLYINLKIISKGADVCSYCLLYENSFRYTKIMGETYSNLKNSTRIS